MSQLIERLLARAGKKVFTGHDLRRTFATLVTTASHDEFLAMRLIRDPASATVTFAIQWTN